MQLIVDIKKDSIAQKIIKLLEIFKNDGVEVKLISNDKKDLKEYDIDYEKSYEYKLDRAEFEEMKEKL